MERKTKIANCSICLEYMNSSGNHQICCLKCGHIFGRRCIEHTLRKNGLCPICKKTARVNDIRNLFNANISVRDIGDRDIWENKYHLAMNKLQHQLMRTQSFQTKLNKLKNTNNNLQQTNKTLKLELLKMKSQYHNEQNQRIELLTQDTNIILDQFKFNTNTNRKQNDLNNQNIKLQTNVNILNNKNNIMNRIGEPITAKVKTKIAFGNNNMDVCKTFEFDINCENIFYGNCNGYGNYGYQYNITKFNMIHNKYDNIFVEHSQIINDIKYRKQTQTEILSISNDKNISVSDIRMRDMTNRKYYFSLPYIGVKCLWSNKSEYCIYAACNNGYIGVYDIRRNTQSIGCKPLTNNCIITLCELNYNYNNQILIASKNNCFILNEFDLINGKFKSEPFICNQQQQQMYSCKYNKKCNSIVMTYENYHSIVNLKDLNNKINVNIDSDMCNVNSDIFCMDNNKYICFATQNMNDKKQKLNIYSCDWNDNDEFRFKYNLILFNKNTKCNHIKIFENKMIGALCNKYMLFYTCEKETQDNILHCE